MKLINKISKLIISLAMILNAESLDAQIKYKVIDLGTLGANLSLAEAINDNGQIACTSLLPNGFDYDNGFLWENGKVTDIGTLEGGLYSAALDINNLGQIVGGCSLDSAHNRDGHAFVWQSGSMIDLGGGHAGSAYGMNEQGTIVGNSLLPRGPNGQMEGPFAVQWINNIGPQDLVFDSLGGTALDVNNLNQVVGHYISQNKQIGFLWNAGSVTNLGTLSPQDINDNGEIVGTDLVSIHAIFWHNGAAKDLGILAGASSSGAFAINEAGEIVGTSGNHAFVFIKDSLIDLNSVSDTSDGWILNVAHDINNNGNIVGWGLHNGIKRAFLLEPGLSITKPKAGEFWTAGEKDTIKWVGGESGKFVDIKFSIDSGKTFNPVEFFIPADSGYYIWNSNDAILSTKAMIKIFDDIDTTITDTSDLFKIKGYVLTRIDGNGNYKPFKMFHDSWKFGNGEIEMWPESWWMQFNYLTGTDPYTGQRYDPIFTTILINAKPEDFPDWPLFVKVFGFNNCYTENLLGNKIPKFAKQLKWSFIKGSFGGCCWGFAMSAILAFENKNAWLNQFEAPDYTELYSLDLNDVTRRAVNEAFVYSYGDEFISNVAQGVLKTPNETIAELKDILHNNVTGNVSINIDNLIWPANIFAHAVTPYKITKDKVNENINYIHVYDENYEDQDTPMLTVNTATNTWKYNRFSSKNVGGTRGIFISPPATDLLQTPEKVIHKVDRKNQMLSTSETTIKMYTSSRGSTKIIDQSGNFLDFNSEDSTINNNITGAFPIVPISDIYHAPVGYILPAGNSYSSLLKNIKDSVAYLGIETDSLTLYAGRIDADSTQSDWITFDGAIGIKNKEASSKKYNLAAVITESNGEKAFELLNLKTINNDSLKFNIYQHDKLKLLNSGSQKNYDIELRGLSNLGVNQFKHLKIPLSVETTHFIEPNWDNANTLKILVDLGNDGTIDDSLILDNELTEASDKRPLSKPTEYYLSQNYPNPFNPATKIRYSIPFVETYRVVSVQLKVYDILGREVATLVNEQQQPGNYEVEFNPNLGANNYLPLSSGIYFYQLKAGDVIQTRKMILLK